MVPRHLLALALLLVPIGCGADVPAEDPVDDATEAVGPPADLAERLAQLGYAEFADQSADSGQSGVVLSDERRTPGHDMVVAIPFGRATLIDEAGEPVQEWSADAAMSFIRCELLPDGDVIIVGVEGDRAETSRFIMRQTWDGEEVWRRSMNVHHDVELTPSGQLLTIASRDRMVPELLPTRAIEDNFVTRFDLDGNVVDEVSLLDALQRGPGAFPFAQLFPDDDGSLDLLHTNSAKWIPPELVGLTPFHVEDAVLVSMRHQSMIAIIDWSEKSCVWSFGRPAIIRQHEATFLPDGRILLFDNGGSNRPWSRLVEVAPVTRTITWEWSAPTKTDFFSRGRGSSQRFANGNVLAANSNSGEAFEVTRSGDVVWRYFTPYVDESDRRAAIRIERYPNAFVESILSNR